MVYVELIPLEEIAILNNQDCVDVRVVCIGIFVVSNFHCDLDTGEAVEGLRDEKFPWRQRKQRTLELATLYRTAKLDDKADKVVSSGRCKKSLHRVWYGSRLDNSNYTTRRDFLQHRISSHKYLLNLAAIPGDVGRQAAAAPFQRLQKSSLSGLQQAEGEAYGRTAHEGDNEGSD